MNASLLAAYMRDMARVNWLGAEFGDHLALFLHSLREPGELSQCFEQDDSTVKIIVVIIIIIINTWILEHLSMIGLIGRWR